MKKKIALLPMLALLLTLLAACDNECQKCTNRVYKDSLCKWHYEQAQAEKAAAADGTAKQPEAAGEDEPTEEVKEKADEERKVEIPKLEELFIEYGGSFTMNEYHITPEFRAFMASDETYAADADKSDEELASATAKGMIEGKVYKSGFSIKADETGNGDLVIILNDISSGRILNDIGVICTGTYDPSTGEITVKGAGMNGTLKAEKLDEKIIYITGWNLTAGRYSEAFGIYQDSYDFNVRLISKGDVEDVISGEESGK